MKAQYITTAVSAGLLVSGSCMAQTSAKPNIVCILVDDLGYGDLSCQGGKDIRTPHIDRIMNEGVRFTNFHSNCPVSSPSRAALLTGRYPDKVGVPGVIRTHPDDSWGYLSPNAVLLPQVLKTAGYQSAIIGKWHLGLEAPNTPNEKGFDYFKGFLGDMMDDYYTHLRWNNNYMRMNDQLIDPEGHATDLFSDWAIDYLNQQKDRHQPFFLYLAYNAPHTPIQPPHEWVEKVKKREPGITDKRAKIVALIEHLDAGIARVWDTLEANGQLENTLVIFTSDNGGQEDAGADNGIYRGAKEDMYEGGIRVAAGVYWKGKIKAGRESDNFAMLSDLFPTVCEIAGAQYTHAIDGVSILPVLLGEKQVTDDRTVHWVRREGNMRYGGMAYYATRKGDYKILQNTPWEPIQLFNVVADPSEKQPLDKKQYQQIYELLFRNQMEHIRQTGSIPWQQ